MLATVVVKSAEEAIRGLNSLTHPYFFEMAGFISVQEEKMKQEEKTEEGKRVEADNGDGDSGDREEKLTREFVKATEEFFTEIKGKYGGYEEIFKDVGIDIIRL